MLPSMLIFQASGHALDSLLSDRFEEQWQLNAEVCFFIYLRERFVKLNAAFSTSAVTNCKIFVLKHVNDSAKKKPNG